MPLITLEDAILLETPQTSANAKTVLLSAADLDTLKLTDLSNGLFLSVGDSFTGDPEDFVGIPSSCAQNVR